MAFRQLNDGEVIEADLTEHSLPIKIKGVRLPHIRVLVAGRRGNEVGLWGVNLRSLYVVDEHGKPRPRDGGWKWHEEFAAADIQVDRP